MLLFVSICFHITWSPHQNLFFSPHHFSSSLLLFFTLRLVNQTHLYLATLPSQDIRYHALFHQYYQVLPRLALSWSSPVLIHLTSTYYLLIPRHSLSWHITPRHTWFHHITSHHALTHYITPDLIIRFHLTESWYVTFDVFYIKSRFHLSSHCLHGITSSGSYSITSYHVSTTLPYFLFRE